MTLISRQFMPARPLELGQIKIGNKGPKQKSAGGTDMQRPMRLDHFVVTTMEKDGIDNYVKDEKIHAIVGAEPRELTGTLMYSSVEDNFHSEMCEWEGRTKKVWTCDGVTGTNLVTGEEGLPCRCAAMPAVMKKPCKPYMRLHLQLDATSTSLGYHVFRSGSWKTVNQIQTVLEEIYQRCGTCYGAPVKLVCFKTRDQYQDKGRVRTGQSLKVGLLLNMPYVEARQVMALYSGEAHRQKFLPVTRELDVRDKQEEADIGAEFAPTEADVEPSVKTNETLEGLASELAAVEADWEIEEEESAPSSASRDYMEARFQQVLESVKLNYLDVITAWAAADDFVPTVNAPDSWEARHFAYAAEVALREDGVRFMIPYVLGLASSVRDEKFVAELRERVKDDGYTRVKCNADLKAVRAALKAQG